MISPNLNIKAYDYGDSLDLGDFAVGGTSISTINISEVETGSSLQISGNNTLINTLQAAIDAGKTWYQLKLGLSNVSDDNETQDILAFYPRNAITLIINYSE